jgi:uncharacterized protein with PIN domain
MMMQPEAMKEMIDITMFCSKCGKKLEKNSQFCNACGTAIAEKAIASINDEKIRAELKNYQRLTSDEVTCLECGYSGFMGISNQKIVKFGSIKGLIYSVLTLIVTLIATLLGPILILRIFAWIGGLRLLYGIWVYVSRRYIVCPSCNRLLERKS